MGEMAVLGAVLGCRCSGKLSHFLRFPREPLSGDHVIDRCRKTDDMRQDV